MGGDRDVSQPAFLALLFGLRSSLGRAMAGGPRLRKGEAMQYLVTQSPKRKFPHLFTVAVVVEASTTAAAIQQAIAAGEAEIKNCPRRKTEYLRPLARPLSLNRVFFL